MILDRLQRLITQRSGQEGGLDALCLLRIARHVRGTHEGCGPWRGLRHRARHSVKPFDHDLVAAGLPFLNIQFGLKTIGF
ncbi:hypothetical protein [Sphingobium sp.]|uniref:hypothetical protein n=1 Tax=Sphingobium sp. TaxID=1912891 RepID=UPI0028BD287F|nr:hypothetical protein [Sphingobium sp.]